MLLALKFLLVLSVISESNRTCGQIELHWVSLEVSSLVKSLLNMAPVVFDLFSWQAVLLCLLFAVVYVGSLYLWGKSGSKYRWVYRI